MVVYFHCNPVTYEVFYIGIGRRADRAFTFGGRNFLWNKYVIDNGKPIVRIIHTGLDKEDACLMERFYIMIYVRNANGGQLTNLAKGGNGGKPEGTRSKKNKKVLERYLLGISKQPPKEIKENVKKIHGASKPVLMIDRNTKQTVKRFVSIVEAKKYLSLPYSNGNISIALRGKNLSAYGYLWKYE